MSNAVTVTTCARHAHLSEAHMMALFGYPNPTPLTWLMQPGQYSGHERIMLMGPTGKCLTARVLGPSRSETQIEISQTDARFLGIEVPVRMSGDLEGSAAITIATEDGRRPTELTQGVIISMPHIHMGPDDVPRPYSFTSDDFMWDGKEVALYLPGPRPTIIRAVLRVQENAVLEAHIDTDQANSANIISYSTGYFGDWRVNF